MKAIRAHAFCTPEGLLLDEIERPVIGAADALVRVECASVNPLDLKMLTGVVRERFPLSFPYVVGIDLSGVIVEVGTLVKTLSVGDRVMGRLEPGLGQGSDFSRVGAFAEYVSVPAKHLALAPRSISLGDSAGIPTAAGTAWQALVEEGRVQGGQTVLIHAAAGGVGSHAVQIAKLLGARVIATASAPNHDLVLELGADEVLDYRKTDISQVVRNVDFVLDTVGGDTQTLSYPTLHRGGVLASITSPPNDATAREYGVSAIRVSHTSDGARLSLLSSLVYAGKLRTIIDRTYALEDAPNALAHSASGHARGKILVRARN
jgi:NADPH:quinone reductase-like Zn-dependent oxidoreductase